MHPNGCSFEARLFNPVLDIIYVRGLRRNVSLMGDLRCNLASNLRDLSRNRRGL